MAFIEQATKTTAKLFKIFAHKKRGDKRELDGRADEILNSKVPRLIEQIKGYRNEASLSEEESKNLQHLLEALMTLQTNQQQLQQSSKNYDQKYLAALKKRIETWQTQLANAQTPDMSVFLLMLDCIKIYATAAADSINLPYSPITDIDNYRNKLLFLYRIDQQLIKKVLAILDHCPTAFLALTEQLSALRYDINQLLNQVPDLTIPTPQEQADITADITADILKCITWVWIIQQQPTTTASSLLLGVSCGLALSGIAACFLSLSWAPILTITLVCGLLSTLVTLLYLQHQQRQATQQTISDFFGALATNNSAPA